MWKAEGTGCLVMSHQKLDSTCIRTKKRMFLYIEWLFCWMQPLAPIQLISFWFHEICMGYQQELGGELWFPGDVARYGGGIQIMSRSKLAPRVFSLLRCSKNTVMAQKLQTVKLWQRELHMISNVPSSFQALRNTDYSTPHSHPPCADCTMHFCPMLLNGPLRKMKIHNLCCRLKLSQRTSQTLTTENKTSRSFSQQGVWLQKKQPALQCGTVQRVTRLQPSPCF